MQTVTCNIMRVFLVILIFFLKSINCTCQIDTSYQIADTSDYIKVLDTQMAEIIPLPRPYWIDSRRVKLKIKRNLKYHKRFLCDSAVAVDYSGFRGPEIYSVLNKSGHWINTIVKRKKLTDKQLKSINLLFGNSKSFAKPMSVDCFYPSWAIVYFEKGKAIGISTISLMCGRLKSTAMLGNGKYYSHFNKKALRLLEVICNELDFSDCNMWPE